MCGFAFCAGELSGQQASKDGTFKSACDLMKLRGPDGSGIATLVDEVAGPVRLGHRRLVIQELK